MKKETKDKIMKIVADSIPICLILLLCIAAFFWRKNWELLPQTVAFVNMLAAIVLVIIIFKAAKKRSVNWMLILGIIAPMYFFNELNNEAIFYEIFHVKLFPVWSGIGIAVALVVFIRSEFFRIMISKIERVFEIVIAKILIFLNTVFGIWDYNQKNEEERRREQYFERQKRKEEKRRWKEERKKHVAATGESVETYTSDTNIVNKETNAADNTRKDKILFGVVAAILFVGTVALIGVMSSDFKDLVGQITVTNWITLIVSCAVVVLLLIFAGGIIFSTFVKWVHIIIAIFKNEGKKELYLGVTLCLFIVSQYFYNTSDYTQDDLADLLVNGKIFTFPLVLSILIPIFLIFAENILSSISNSSEIKDVLRNCKKQSIKIAGDTVSSLFTFIQFVTSDYLKDIIELTEESIGVVFDDIQGKETSSEENETTEDTHASEDL